MFVLALSLAAADVVVAKTQVGDVGAEVDCADSPPWMVKSHAATHHPTLMQLSPFFHCSLVEELGMCQDEVLNSLCPLSCGSCTAEVNQISKANRRRMFFHSHAPRPQPPSLPLPPPLPPNPPFSPAPDGFQFIASAPELRTLLEAARGTGSVVKAFVPGGDYLLDGSPFAVDGFNLTLVSDALNATLDAKRRSRHFDVTAGSSLELRGIHLIGGRAAVRNAS